MMKKITLLIFLFTTFRCIFAQKIDSSIVLNTKLKSIARSKSSNVIFPVYIKVAYPIADSALLAAIVKVAADQERSTLNAGDYMTDFTPRKVNELNPKDSSKNVVYVTLLKDSLPDRERKIILQLQIYKGDSLEKRISDSFPKLTIKVEAIKSDTTAEYDSTIKNYSYLLYTGTNFDLIDGVKPKNLFLAANILLSPNNKKPTGIYLSLYGNRTMSYTDTADRRVQKAAGIVRLTDTTSRIYSRQMSLSRTVQSDNLGIYFSPLWQMKWLSSISDQLKIYITPTFEFVWRRTNASYQYTNPASLDSMTIKGSTNGIDTSSTYNSTYSEYINNYGLGLMVVHENKNISIRAQASWGLSRLFDPNTKEVTTGLFPVYKAVTDWFFTGRLWITEAVTGVTLQAEVTNLLKSPRPYYGVTLSKAFNFKNIGNIFKPVNASL